MAENYTRYNVDVDSKTTRQLLDLNQQFYTNHGHDFSATRERLQPGVMRILETLRGDESILDLGCGNGELARTLSRRGHHGSYLGLDFSLPLLNEAEREAFSFPVKFTQVDLAQLSVISDQLPVSGHQWSVVTAFAVLHHIPSDKLRLSVIQKVHELLKPNGLFIHSNWQFLNSERLKARIQSWDKAGLNSQDVEQNDYLLDWKRGGIGLRYVHHFDKAELAKLAGISEFEIVETFYSDGENKKLGLYQIWKKAESEVS